MGSVRQNPIQSALYMLVISNALRYMTAC